MHSDSPLNRQRLPNLEQGRMGSLPSGKISTDPSVGRQGDMPKEGRVQPQMDVTGVSIAAARCIMPVSPEYALSAARINAADSPIDVFPTRFTTE